MGRDDVGGGGKITKSPLSLTVGADALRNGRFPAGWRFQALWRDYGCISHGPGPSLAPVRNHEQLQQDAGPAHSTPPRTRLRMRRRWQTEARAGAG